MKRDKKALGYAMQELKGDELLSSREPNLANSLSGKVSGLQIVRSSNGVGGSSKIVLRGNSSLTGSNQPLIVVDGTPMDNLQAVWMMFGVIPEPIWVTAFLILTLKISNR